MTTSFSSGERLSSRLMGPPDMASLLGRHRRVRLVRSRRLFPRRLLAHRRPLDWPVALHSRQIERPRKGLRHTEIRANPEAKTRFMRNGASWTPSKRALRPKSADMRPGAGRKTAQSRPEGLESPSSSCLHPARGRDRVPSGMPTNEAKRSSRNSPFSDAFWLRRRVR